MKDAVPGRTLSVAYGDSCSPFCRLSATSSPGRGKSFHSGRALGRTGRFRPHRSTAGRSLPLSCKLYAPAKASPFRERWHGEAVTERVASGTTLSVAYGDSCSPFCRLSATSSPGRGKSFHSGRALGRTGRFRPHRSTAGRSQPLSCKLFTPAKASPFRERWHGKAVTERVACGTNPLSRLRRQLFPFLSPVGDIFPRPGEVFPLRESPWQNRQVSSSPVNGRKKPAVKL